MCVRGGLLRELPNQISMPWSNAAKACDPVPLATHPMDVSRIPCMKKTTSLTPVPQSLSMTPGCREIFLSVCHLGAAL